jgi:hypothetical protein
MLQTSKYLGSPCLCFQGHLGEDRNNKIRDGGVEDQFSTQTRTRAVNTRMALATTRKGSLSVAEYLTKMQALGDGRQASRRRRFGPVHTC